ncbi:zinc carboxypeptidase [Deinococcus altitudinis]|uniref:zinc carboxypeptidase n=1 Tax=Deinococcus altitudinis TaxID=468914 RepID=UPI003891E802
MTTEAEITQTHRTDTSRPGPARTVWEAQFPWEGERLLDRLRSEARALPPGSSPVTVHAYVSESPEVRAMLKAQVSDVLRALDRDGVVSVRSAYKTGYFWLTEEVQPLWRRAQADRLSVTYPAGPEDSPGRFLQELYPLAALLEREGLAVEFLSGGAGSSYSAELFRGAVQVWAGSCFVPLRPRQSTDGRAVVGPTGWLTLRAGTGGAHDQPLHDGRLATDGELFWDWYCGTVLPRLLALADQRPGLPIFRNLSVELSLSEPDLDIGVLDERISMTEALSEEVYFGTVDALKRHLAQSATSRSLMPGRIVPVVTAAPGRDGWARVILSEYGAVETPAEHPTEAFGPGTAVNPGSGQSAFPWNPLLTWRAAREQADRFQLEWHVAAMSVEGRPVPAVVRRDDTTGGILVTGGQHANETTGPVAAVQLIGILAASPVPFAVLPLENPDGAALHRALIQGNPDHMHHAARYTSLGDDLEARVRDGRPRWESRGRVWAAQAVQATLHLNLHGYPAHEWVRPYSGYAPFGFESWALPAGFVTILWYHPGFSDQARSLANAIASRLLKLPDVVAHAGLACRANAAHSARPHYELIQGLPFILTEQPAALCPLTVITEAPDETVYGERFRMFVRAHLAVCEAAVTHHQAQRDGRREGTPGVESR